MREPATRVPEATISQRRRTCGHSSEWQASQSDLKNPPMPPSNLRRRRPRAIEDPAATSEVPRNHSNPARISENGVSVDGSNTSLQRNRRSQAEKLHIVGEVLPLQSTQRYQSNRVPPQPTAISPRRTRMVGSADTATPLATLRQDGNSTGSPAKSATPSCPANLEDCSPVRHVRSYDTPGSPFLCLRPPLAQRDPQSGLLPLPRRISSVPVPSHDSTISHTRHRESLFEPESDDESLPTSPRSVNSSVLGAEETPMTSPSRSPTKQRPTLCHYPPLILGVAQLDGECGLSDEAEGDQSSHDTFHTTLTHLTEPEDDAWTPLVTPSFANDPPGLPFGKRSAVSSSVQSLARHPSMLLRQCERNATLRQRRLMSGGAQTPDRFIPTRSGTPNKESLLLARQRLKQPRFAVSMPLSDPFGPAPSRSLRMAEQYATLRVPPAPPRYVGRGTRAEESPGNRAPSTGSVWTVGGTLVTEGIASVTNGRGGRVTSGTNAPHFSADFLGKKMPSEDEIMHSRRLAVALGIDQSARMLVHGSTGSPSPDSPATPSGTSASPKSIGRVWRDGVWQEDGAVTPTKYKTKKVKSVPIIPFRVLDAPALRDDYYCSLLAYSPTLQCLAMGLGPHVYLWSERRERTDIPESLTAAAGSAHVTSVSFSSLDGGSAILALGRADGRITLWSPLDRDPRFDSDQPSPISCLAFRPVTVIRASLRDTNVKVPTEDLVVGDELGYVYYYSVEWPNQEQRDLFDWHGSMTLLARIHCHSQQVCGLAWSSDGQYFATGGNDNQLFLFESKNMEKTTASRRTSADTAVHVRAGSSNSSSGTVTGQGPVLAITPGLERQIFTLNAAIKAIAFAPWQPTLLAAGGGSNDRCIHFFHTLSGSTLATIDCHAQVTSLVWSTKRKEVAGTFGFAQPDHAYRVAVFAWPSCEMVVKIPWWGEERALFAVAYPRGPTTGMRPSESSATQRADAEGRPWYGRRTREEGCLVVATSDASIKFHEIWAEKDGRSRRVESGVFGGSQILEEEHSGDIERWGTVIR